MSDPAKTILVVDDDPDIVSQTRTVLEAAGFGVVTAESEREAEDVLQRTTPDLAVLDLMMEHQDSGFILAHRLKRRLPDLPVIIVTAVSSVTGIHFDAATREERSWVKADVIMEKDIRYEQLLAEIHRLLKE
jgi:CheY-like chemotaxis protein